MHRQQHDSCKYGDGTPNQHEPEVRCHLAGHASMIGAASQPSMRLWTRRSRMPDERCRQVRQDAAERTMRSSRIPSSI